MKYIIKPLACFFLLNAMFSGIATASNTLHGCAEKEYRIQKQLEYARTYGNIHRVEGLERALKKTRLYCTDNKITSGWQEKVAEKEEKVSERMAELRRAQASGKSDKIRKKERKLQEAKDELREARSGLIQSINTH